MTICVSLFLVPLQALVMAMRTSTRNDGSLIVSVKNCDTSQNDESLFNVAKATGEYTLDLQVMESAKWLTVVCTFRTPSAGGTVERRLKQRDASSIKTCASPCRITLAGTHFKKSLPRCTCPGPPMLLTPHHHNFWRTYARRGLLRPYRVVHNFGYLQQGMLARIKA